MKYIYSIYKSFKNGQSTQENGVVSAKSKDKLCAILTMLTQENYAEIQDVSYYYYLLDDEKINGFTLQALNEMAIENFEKTVQTLGAYTED